ncbi:hypothetical protein LZ554_006348 [Drepanopeziza brunnea f. sp. 'monogermtubi']|nr:hypothetical protein LZ554_006348 [Drepanopeziza brunnea f. sp. 'monogermtubi']
MTSSKPEKKPELHFDTSEYESPTFERQHKADSARLVGLGLTVLALLSSIVVVGTAGDTLGVYNKTTLGSEFHLSLWPTDFDLRPTVALVTCGIIIMLSSIAFLVATQIPAIKNIHIVSTSVSYLAPTISLIASLIATSFFYGVNASNTTSSLQSWSCQWSSIDMHVQPHWSSLCKQSKVALYLTVMMIPLQVFVLGTAAWGALAAKKESVQHERMESPATS